MGSEFDRRVVIPDLAEMPRRNSLAESLTLHGSAFGTTWQVSLLAEPVAMPGGLDALRRDCERIAAEWLELVDRQMSPYRADSDLTRFNQAPAWQFVPLPEEMMQVVHHALEIAVASEGAFDPALLSAVELWGFGARTVSDGLPPEAEVSALCAAAQGWRDLIWQPEGMIRPDGVRLDLCAIAKGYAVDGLADRLRVRPGVIAGLIEIGGELKGWGVRPDGLPWWVEVEGDETLPCTVIALSGWAVATSGDSRRAFEHGGQRLSHTLDARTMRPTRSNIASATVIDPQAWRADALATALIVMGEAAALDFAEAQKIPCLLRLRDGVRTREAMSPAWQAWT
jgi:thiamine biosynthesis lipoprotein